MDFGLVNDGRMVLGKMVYGIVALGGMVLGKMGYGIIMGFG